MDHYSGATNFFLDVSYVFVGYISIFLCYVPKQRSLLPLFLSGKTAIFLKVTPSFKSYRESIPFLEKTALWINSFTSFLLEGLLLSDLELVSSLLRKAL